MNKTILNALQQIGELLTAEFRATIDRVTTSRAKGKLRNSVKYKTVQTNEGIGLERSMNDYGNYLDSGVRGTKSKYAKNPQSFFNIGQFVKPIISKQSGLPFAVRISIAQNGLKPKPFINPSISNVMGGKGLDILEEAAVKEVMININDNLEDITIG